MLVDGIEIDDALRRRKNKAIKEASFAAMCIQFPASLAFMAGMMAWSSWPWIPGLLPVPLVIVTSLSWYRAMAAKIRILRMHAEMNHGGSVRAMVRFQRHADRIRQRERDIGRLAERRARRARYPSFCRFVLDGLSGKGWEIPSCTGAVPLPDDPGPAPPAREETLARTLRNAREMSCKTQEHVALEAEVSVRTVRRAETTGRVSSENLRSLCSALGLSLPGGHCPPPSDAPAWTRIPAYLSRSREGMGPFVAVCSLTVLVMAVLAVMPRDCPGRDWLSCRTAVDGVPLSDVILPWASMMAVAGGLIVLLVMMSLVESLPSWRRMLATWITGALVAAGGYGSLSPHFRNLEHGGDAAAAAAVASIRSSVPTLAAGLGHAGTDMTGQPGSR